MTLPEHVIDTARRLAQISATVSTAPAGIAVCQDEDGYRYYSADAWTFPIGMPIMPWRPPKLKPIAVVKPDGTVLDPE